MGRSSITSNKQLRIPIIGGAIVAIVLIAALVYLNKPVPKQSGDSGATPEAKAYVSNLALSDVSMKAAENFMKQRVVEIDGKITNKGNRTLRAVDIFCLFYGVDGREIYREKVPIVAAKAQPLGPGEARPFRLPFDTLPDTWNQAMPKMIIARIEFAA